MIKEERKHTIENLCALAKALFCEVEIGNVLSGQVYFDDISCESVARLAVRTQKLYERCSELECQKKVEAISDAMCRKDRQRMRVSRRGKIHVFELLADLDEYLLLIQNGEVLCRYMDILSWRDLVQSIGEEIPVSAMYAISDLAAGESTRLHFTWSLIVRQNNETLNEIFHRGISEHHMHLWPSVPYFQVSWLNLMNNPLNGAYMKKLHEIDRTEWNLRQRAVYSKEYLHRVPYTADRANSMVTLCRQAALIRAYLCGRLKGFTAEPDSGRAWTLGWVKHLLNYPENIYINSDELRNQISALQNGTQEMDYMLRMFQGQQMKGQEEYTVFSGERWFLYSMIRDIYLTYPSLCREEHNLFYAYLMIMIQLRTRMVQTDQRTGFDNFQRIQNRKGYFLGDPRSAEKIARLAIREPLKRVDYLREMEVRIVPRDTAQKIRQDIQVLENIGKQHREPKRLEENPMSATQESLWNRYYYVLHFIKKQDEDLERIKSSHDEAGARFFHTECRHDRYRKQLEKTACAIRLFREHYARLACRVGGIDACSQEIGCRPEVFAPVFRALGEHTCLREDLGEQIVIPRLRKTYHVGEDFLDIADGLRAIDEAIRFLGLDCGDRLGHALALCLDPYKWYQAKNLQISLPVQDYIDNLAWLYHAIQRYHIPQQNQVVHFLEKEFRYYFNRVYISNMKEEELDYIMNAATEFYRNHDGAKQYRQHSCDFSIDLYCYAWMLRGDAPVLYQEGYFKPLQFPIDSWERHWLNEVYPQDVGIRYIPECSLLYYFYHYSEAVKYAGTEIVNIAVDQNYISAVKAVQHKMQFEIAQRGLSIESNPTSNAKISTFREYSEHPMIALYNRGLVHSTGELRNCAQVHVSINTDDSGVFFTSLESEYAVMARALEEIVDENGEPRFYRWEIYEWLDQIRRMGNAQSFAR